ncbi:MAG: DMT family transporter [Tabrizicola sp.]|nr:DMT family transporter [Tabrizicola sp.]
MSGLPASQVSRGIALMLLAVLCFATMDALAKGLVARYPAPQVVWVRYFGQLVIVLVLLNRHALAALRTDYPWQHLARSAFQFGATALFFLSLTRLGLAEATALADISPVLITVAAAIFLGEKLGPRRLAGVVAAMIGALIIIRPGSGIFSPWALLPIGAALSYAGNAVLTRHLGMKEPVWTSLLHASIFGTVVSSLALPVVWEPVTGPDLWLFVVVGVLGTTAQLFLIRSFSTTEAAVVAPFTYLGIVVATFWGIVLYGQWPDRWTVIGALVIAGAGLYVWHRENRATRVP